MKTANKIYSLSTILLLLSAIFAISCTNKKTTGMKPIEFIPKEFNDVKLGFNETLENPCSPGYPLDITGFLWNKIVINTPRKIICRIGNDTLIPVIPVCGAYIITGRRESKYYDLGAWTFHIRKINDKNWFTGEIVDKSENPGIPALPPNYQEEQRELEKERIEAQSYSEEELEEGQASGGFFNENLMDYVEIPFEPGVYEIYFSTSGLESNRVKVEIVFEEDDSKKLKSNQTEAGVVEEDDEIVI